MQTALADFIKNTPEGKEAEGILRNCVHCGFCLATCPTYQLLGDELDGPRGRIYLMKQVLEGQPVTGKTQLHLDRCLTCRACETTCPSGVHYSRLLEIGRQVVDSRVPRPTGESLARIALRKVITRPALFRSFVKMGQLVRLWLPEKLRYKVPPVPSRAGLRPHAVHARRMLVLEGCVQPTLSPATNAAAARILDRLGITLIAAPQAGCCGALSLHLDARAEALDFMRQNIDAWWPYIEQGVEAVVVTASGCGVMVKDYGYQLAHDPEYAQKAARVSELTRDIGEAVLAERTKLLALVPPALTHALRKVAFHAPCTLQHGFKIRPEIESLLTAAGFELAPVRDAHLCCGSAGTYSILQPDLSQRLLANKIAALTEHLPEEIVTANIGCQSHIQTATDRPVRHWIELVEERLTTV